MANNILLSNLRKKSCLFVCCVLFGWLQVSAQNYVLATLSGSPVNTTGWDLNGYAQVGNITSSDNSEILLTNALNGLSGAVFFNQAINPSLCKRWTVEFDFRMFDGNSADGIAFCYLDVPPSGFVSGGGLGIPGFANGLKICFDTYPNCTNNFSEMPKIEARWGQGYDECWAQPTLSNSGGSLSFLRSNNYNRAKITYEDGAITVYVNNNIYLQAFQQFDFPGYLGFTASTGGLNDRHSIKNVVIYTDIPPSDAGINQSICSNGSTQIGSTPNTNYVYNWTPSLGLNNTTIANPIVNINNPVNTPITYTYIVTTALAATPACSSTDTVAIKVLPNTILTPDTIICGAGPIQLRAQTALSYSWSPANAFLQPNSKDPILQADSTRTYQLTSGFLESNLLINGDFEQGNTGFQTDLVYCNSNNCLIPLADNGYAVGATPSFFHNAFMGNDHSSGSGQMLIVNGAIANQSIWKQTVAVQPFTNYFFGGWLSAMNTIQPASIQFYINGVPQGDPINAPNNTGIWEQSVVEWNSSNLTQAILEIRFLQSGSNGLDIALDDLYFGPVLYCTNQVAITVFQNSFNPLPDSSFTCNTSTTLQAGSGFSNYQWSTGENTPAITVQQSGWYRIICTSSAGCTASDSSYVEVGIAPIVRVVDSTICNGNSYTLPSGTVVQTSGVYQDTLFTIKGCDSLITQLSLRVIVPNTLNQFDTICAGNSFQLPSGIFVQTAGIYKDTIRASNGCDSIYRNIQLSVTAFSIQQITDTICEGSSYLLPSGLAVNQAGIYLDTLRNQQGCALLISRVNLNVQTAARIYDTVTICQGQGYNLPSGNIISLAGNYLDTLRYQSGCDSIILQLQLLVAQPTIQNLQVTRCFGQTYQLPSGLVITASGNYTDTLKFGNGCDSLITRLQLTILSPIEVYDTVKICTGQTYTLPSGIVVQNAGTYRSTLISISGCDSIVSSTVQIYPPLTAQITGIQPVCMGNILILNAIASGGNGGPYQFRWSTPNQDTTAQINFTPTATGTIQVSIADGCTTAAANTSGTITVYPKPIIDYTISPVAGCVPLAVQFLQRTPSGLGTSFDWQFGDGITASTIQPNHLFTAAGTYNVMVKATSAQGCVDSSTLTPTITVVDQPIARFTYSPANPTIGRSAIYFSDSSLGATQWLWQFGDQQQSSQQNPYHLYSASGSFPVQLIIQNQYNCKDTTTTLVPILPLNNIYIPSAFSPNGDGLNDRFSVFGIGLQRTNMEIYNRYGQLVFRSSDYVVEWNGIDQKTGKPCMPGNYVYIIQLVNGSGIKQSFKGNIMLIR